MEYIDQNILCLTYTELVPGYMTVGSYNKNRVRGKITVHGLGGNGRKVLVEFESLPEKYKTAIREKIGNPYEYMAKQPIVDQVDWDMTAQQFYADYVLPNGQNLPNSDVDGRGKPQINYVKRYTKAASWLNMIARLTADKRELKRSLNLTVTDFWEVATELIVKEDVAIPANAKRLKEKVKTYSAEADEKARYAQLVELFRFGNQSASKITEKQAQATLFAMLKDANKHDFTVVCAGYNLEAQRQGWKTIDVKTVANFYHKNRHIIDPAREGMKKSYTKSTKQIHRKRSEYPLAFVNSDDNQLDLFFKVETYDKTGKKKVNNFYRPAVYIITDTYNDYILGYAWGDKITKEVIYAAFRNAVEHIYELTGGYYLPQQLQTDHWGLDVKLNGDLAQFFKMVGGKFIAQAHGVPQGKYIERTFGVELHQVLKAMPGVAYAGHNITAKERLSTEHMAEVAKNAPSVELVPQVLHQLITVMRLKGNPKTKISRQKEWVEAFLVNENCKKRQIDTGLKLDMLGVKRAGEPLQITSKGLEFAVNKQKYLLDVPDDVIYLHNGKKVDVIYNPERMDEFLVTDHKGLRFVTGLYDYRPAAMADYTDGSRLQLQQDFDGKKRISHLMATAIDDRLKDLGDVDPQGLLQAGVIVKDLKNDAEASYLAELYGGKALPEAPKKELPAPKAKLPKASEDGYDVRDFY